VPNRLIRGTILESKKFNRLSEPAQLFFFRLMMVADDYGYYMRDPELIRSYAYPRMPNKSVEEIESHMLECLSIDDPLTGKLLVDHGTYVEIRNYNQRLRLKKSSKYKNDGHMTVICQSHGAKMTTSPSTSSSSLEEGKEGGVGGEKGEEGVLDDGKSVAEKIVGSIDPKYSDLIKAVSNKLLKKDGQEG
jgi:hypothetical protein